MIFFKDDKVLLDTSDYKLNFGILKFDEYKGSSEKLIKSDSFLFDDFYLYRPRTYSGCSCVLEVFLRDFLKSEFLLALRNGNRLSLPRDNGKFREYIVDGNIVVKYYDEGYIYLKIPLYLFAFVYEVNESSYSIEKGLIYDVENRGNVFAEPVFVIKGSGDLIMSVNGRVSKFRNATGGYVVNCRNKLQNVTDLDGNLKNVTSEFDGVFPALDVGVNRVQLISGDSLFIKVNWRFLE